MNTATATFSTTDNNSQNGINVWFDVTDTIDNDENGVYALCVENGEITTLLDCDGCPCNTDDNHISVVFDACKDALTIKMINS